eukprot:12419989-Karenia_brevis.AAC.1
MQIEMDKLPEKLFDSDHQSTVKALKTINTEINKVTAKYTKGSFKSTVDSLKSGYGNKLAQMVCNGWKMHLGDYIPKILQAIAANGHKNWADI